MNESKPAVLLLQKTFIATYPAEATRLLEKLPAGQIAEILGAQPLSLALPVWERLVPDIASRVVERLHDAQVRELLQRLNPSRSAIWLAGMARERQEHYLGLLEPGAARELLLLMAYPADCAGALMDPRILVFRPEMTVKEGLQRLRDSRRRDVRSVFVVDSDSRLVGTVTVQALALAAPVSHLEELMQSVSAAVDAFAPREEVVAKLEEHRLTDLPVIDVNGELIGVVRPHALMAAVENEASVKLQTMVGVSKEERALSRVSFAILKRQPWLQINLLTAFLAAAVVGLFEETIAQFTALAVLLPVVAGQSGNTGAQALAVTMRGLALREIRARHWLRLAGKEALVGLCNGLAVAAVTALGVWVWSGSVGLALVITVAMVLSMVIASIAGAMIPIILTVLGQDPAQSSSIFLTTVTDVAGFFSFLGIATLLSGSL